MSEAALHEQARSAETKGFNSKASFLAEAQTFVAMRWLAMGLV